VAQGTYDERLATDRDWVRFLIGDRGPTFRISDDELDAVLADSANKYFAAADALTSIRDSWTMSTNGIQSKSVDGLSISYGSVEKVNERITWLRKKGADMLATRPKLFRVLVP
jgi:hypothetical protein